MFPFEHDASIALVYHKNPWETMGGIAGDELENKLF
jgi:hypothetical protein